MMNTQNEHRGVTLLIVLALMLMFAMLVTAFMVIVTHARRTAESAAKARITRPDMQSTRGVSSLGRSSDVDAAFQRLLTGGLDNVIGPHSILENLYGEPGAIPFSGTGAGYDPSVTPPAALLSIEDDSQKPLALRPNILAPNADGEQEYKEYLHSEDVRMNPDYTAPDFMTMFLAWNDVENGELKRIIPSFHRPQLVKYWQAIDDPNDPNAFNELRKYVLRPLPTDHPNFTGSNPMAKAANLEKFLTDGPWDVDNDGDGVADGIWLDVGLPVVQDDGRTYKPLVSYYAIDMDGRINVNTLGSLAQSESPDLSGLDDIAENTDVKGTGMGPAELSSSSSLLPISIRETMDITEIMERMMTGVGGHEGRYGSDKIPGTLGGTPWFIRNDAYTGGGLLADWFGFSPIMFDSLGNRIVVVPTPEIENPYLMNPYSNASGDDPFNTDHLESLLRSVLDTDYTQLPPRLLELLGTSFDQAKFAESKWRYNLTTRSSNIPVIANVFAGSDGYVTLYQRVQTLCGNTEKAGKLWELLPEEIRRGEKVNLNRLTLLPDWMTGGTDDTQKRNLLKAKVRFVQEMFYLMQVLFPEQATQSKESLERLAQWSVNLVDFIDPDDVMTPFIFRSTPGSIVVFDVFNVNDVDLIEELLDETLNLPSDCTLLWGFEKSEVALTETLAIHNRNARSMSLGTDNPPNFIQSSRPQGSLFVEIYRQGNSHRSYTANSVIEQNGNLNLAKKTGSGDYIWRLAVGEATKTTAGKFKWDDDDHPERNAIQQLLTPDANDGIKCPQFYQWSDNTDTDGQYRPHLGRPERFIWFGKDFPTERPFTPSAMELRRRSYVNEEEKNVVLFPNSLLVIAPRDITSFNPGIRSNLDFRNSPNVMFAVRSFTSTTPPANCRGVNVSEPLPDIQGDQLVDGYPSAFTTPSPQPFDGRIEGTIPRQRGTMACFKTICLQRLADPNRPHHPIGNPYLTVDWNMVDLHVISSQLTAYATSPVEEPDGIMPHKDDNTSLSSRQWKQPPVSGFSNLWDRVLGTDILDEAKGKAGLEYTGYELSETSPRGMLLTEFEHTLDVFNYPDLADTPFLHFPWHDAPLMNTGELMLVPASAPGRFGVEFHDNGPTNFYGDGTYDWLAQTSKDTGGPRFSYHLNGSTFSPYPNWAGEHLAETPAGTVPEMVHLFDFVHVPTKFAGTRTDEGIVYREPGKINLNTLTEEGWKTLTNGRTTNFPSYDDFRESRQWSTTDYPSEYRPFRSPSATNLVPLDSMVDASPLGATLLGLKKKEIPLIDDAASNPYTVLENAMRLSDVTTTRSNVFAVWVTVGYFEVEKLPNYDENGESDWQKKGYAARFPLIDSLKMYDAVYPDGCVLGAEKGLDDGTVRRYRAFYLIDRSIPVVGFRRGEELNSKDVIIKKTMLK